MIDNIFRTPQGATRGSLQVDWSSYRWRATKACFATLAEEGSRKDEVAKETAQTPPRKGYFTFASLQWRINDARWAEARGAGKGAGSREDACLQ